MNLSNSERRLLNRWKRAEERWPRLRWLAILSSGILTGFYIFAIWWFHAWGFREITDESAVARVGVLATVSPVLWMGLLLSAAWFGFTLARRNGNAKRRLFLKMASEHEKTDA